MKKKILLLTLFMYLIGGVNIKNLNAQTTVTIDGTVGGFTKGTDKVVPVYNNYGYAITQFYYTVDEIAKANGTIESIAFKTKSGQYPYTRTLDIYMVNTDEYYFDPNDNSGKGMKQVSASDLVFSGDVVFTQDSWVKIDLANDFEYTGGNLLLCVNDKTGDYISGDANRGAFEVYSSTYQVPYQGGTGTARRALYHRSTSSAFNPTASAITANATYQWVPFIQFTFKSDSPITLDSPANYTANVFNESLEYTLSGITEYQLYIDKNVAAGTDVTNPTTSITGDDWIPFTSSSDSRHILDLGLEYGTQYVWKVVGKTENGEEISSEVYTFTTKNVTSVPGNITLVSPGDGSSQTVNPVVLSWTFGDNTEEYQVWLGTDNDSDSNIEWECVKDWTNTNNQTTASYQASDLGANTYYWKVVVRNGKGETSSDVFSFIKIGAPGNVTPINPVDGATDVSTNMTLSWTFAPNTTEYRVMFWNLQYSSYEALTGWLSVPQSMEGSCQKSGLQAGANYKWCVEVSNNAGKRTVFEGGDPIAEFSFTTSDIQSVSYASPINNTVITTETATLNWNYGSQNTATHYQVLLGTNPEKMDVVKDWTARESVGTGYQTSGSFTTETLSKNTKYYWRVNIKKGETIVLGEVVSFISKLDNPVTTENAIYCYPGFDNNATATVRWNAVDNVVGYNVYLNDILAGNTTNTEMSVSNLTFNSGNANEVKVVAVYEIDGVQYESSGAIVNVYVSGYIKVSGTISNAYNNNSVSGATVTYTGSSVLADDDEQTVIFTTNGNGAFEGYIPAGTYAMSVQSDNYKDYTGEPKVYNYDIAENAAILSNIPDDVTEFAYDEQPNPLLTWKFAENTTHYRVALSTNQNAPEYTPNNTWIETKGAEEGSFQTSGLVSGTTYYVYIDVRNINATPGDRALYDDRPLDTVNPKYYTFTTSSVFPATLKAPANNATIENPTVTLQWQYVGDAAEYQVCYGTDANNLTDLGWKDRSEIEGGTGGYKSEDEVTIEGLSPATTYYWKVQVKKDGGNVVDSEVRSFTTIDVPDAVTNMQPSNGDNSLNADPNLSWTFGDNTKEYQLLLGTTNPPTDVEVEWTSTPATSSSYQTSGLKANVTYYWQVNVRNGFRETEGTVYSFKKLGIPENVEPIDPTDGATGVSPIVTLTWRFAPNTKYYRVLFDDGSGLAYKVGDKDTWIDVTTEIATFNTESLGLEANETYSWVVDVKNDEGQRTKYQGGGGSVAEYSFTTTDKTAVKNISPSDDAIMTTTTAKLQWEYGTGNIVDHYMVYLGKDKDKLEAVTGWMDRGTAPLGTYTIEHLDNDTRYYWRVDVKYEDEGDVIPGKIGTFVSLLTVPENLTCTANVYPDTPFKISWDPTAEATSYNIYVDGMVVANTTETTYSHTMTDDDYNMTDGHDIQVTAVYEGLGESQRTAAANVKVTGYGTIKGLVHNVNEESVVGVTITLEGTNEFDAEQTITGITTNSVGYFEAKVLAGTYTLKISDATGVYKEYTGTEFELSHEVEKNFHTIILSSDYIYTFSLNNQKASSVMILLSGGTDALLWKPFEVIVEKDGKVVHTAELVTASFSAGYGYGFEYSGVWNMPSGSYRIGIRKCDAPENAVTWKNYNRNYHVFIQDGDWNEPSNWNNGVVPNNSEVHILKAAHIKAGDVVNTSGNVIIEGTYLESSDKKYEGSLKIDGTLKSGGLLMQATFINQEKNAGASVEINGSLVTDKIVNDGSYTNFVLNDGGQFRQIGKSITNNLVGVFNMKIDKPTEWSSQNKTGWQFISSPFQDAEIAKFVSESGTGDYDLYRYDGTNTNEEWLNDKDQNGVTEEEFIQGRAYLASYENAEEVELTGSFYTNNVYDFTQNYEFTYDPEGNLENFHLIGNPFTFDMEWTNIQKSGVVDGYAVVNYNGEYEYNKSGTIKVGDGFFVKTTPGTVQFEYTDNYTATRNREKSNSINIKLKSKSGNDNVIVSFDGREEGFTKLDNFNDESAVISVVDNDRRYAIVNYDEDVKEVELAFEASKMGVYTIEIEPDGDFDKIILVDRFTGEETDMLNGIYKFTASNQDDYNRFLIKLGDGGQEPTEEGDFVYQSGEELILKGKGVLQIVDVMGRVVYAEEVFNDVNRIDISALRDAAYIVRVIGEEGVKVKKVVVY